jgi:hypothetical protein
MGLGVYRLEACSLLGPQSKTASISISGTLCHSWLFQRAFDVVNLLWLCSIVS